MTDEETSIEPFIERFPVLAADLDGLAETMAENLDEDGLSRFDLESIKVGPGGAPGYMIEHGEERDTLKEFTALIVHKHKCRSFWKAGPDDNEVQGTNPDCASNDGKYGFGDIGDKRGETTRECRRCAKAQFGTGKRGRGQACKQQVAVYLYRDGAKKLFPSQLLIPPTSLKPFKSYCERLVEHNIKLSRAVHRFHTRGEKNPDGKAYTVLQVELVRELSKEELAPVSSLCNCMRGAIRTDELPQVGAQKSGEQITENREQQSPADFDEIPF